VPWGAMGRHGVAHRGGVRGWHTTQRALQRGAGRGLPGSCWNTSKQGAKAVYGQKRFGFGAKDSLEAKAQMFESLCHYRVFSLFLRVVSHPRCRSAISPHELEDRFCAEAERFGQRLWATGNATGAGCRRGHAGGGASAAMERAHLAFSNLYQQWLVQPRRSAARRLRRTRPDTAPGWKTDVGHFLSPLRALILRHLRARADFKRNLRACRRAPDKEHLGLANQYRFEYTGVYEDLLFIADDVLISTARDFSYGPFTVSPTAQLSYRFADVPEARRYRLDLLLPLEARITSLWSLVSTPFVEAYWFTDGLNEGRQDIIYSTSLGLRYSIASNISLTTSANYEWRTSNVPLRHYRDLEIGPRLDMAS
jgi:hypothetical protein